MPVFRRPWRQVASLLLLGLLTSHLEASAGQLSLTWVDDASDGVGFSIERSTDSAGPFQEIDVTDTGVTAYSDPTVADGTTYCYRVRAFNATAYSDYSNVACGATAQALSLAVVKMGAGSGTVISSPDGIICGATCSGTYASGTAVTLTATAATGSTFTGWSGGGCAGTGSCIVTLTSATTVTATFATSLVSLSTSKTGTGTGNVSSVPAGIDCGTTCSTSYPYGAAVTLSATPSTGSTFAGWSGACTGTESCTLTLTSSTAVSAAFASKSPTLTVSVSGKGTVTSSPAGINCGKTCTATFPGVTLVTLTAVPASGFAFAGWSGGGCSGVADSCTVSLSTSTAVTATFKNSNNSNGPGKR